jgi:hypothetical protein
MRKRSKAKSKSVPYRFISPTSDVGRFLYDRLTNILLAHHEDVVDARFALAWRLAWKPDVDGHVILGQCRKVSDLDREIVDAYDFIIILNKEWWDDPLVTDQQRNALLDHECCHAAVKRDEAGDVAIDERGRTVYRIRKHDVEDFAEIADRHGCYKRDLEAFAAALDRARQRPAQWIGFTRLREHLIAAGATIPLTIIREWSEAERLEAHVWAALQEELRKGNLQSLVDVAYPAHVAAALDSATVTDATTEARA